MKKEQTLLEKALQTNMGSLINAVPNDEKIELAVAYFNGKIRARQAAESLHKSSTNIGSVLATIIRSGCMNGKVKVQLTSE